VIVEDDFEDFVEDESLFEKYTSQTKDNLYNSLLDEYIRGEFDDLQDQIDQLESVDLRSGGGNGSSSYPLNDF
jgi:hypothetical protein